MKSFTLLALLSLALAGGVIVFFLSRSVEFPLVRTLVSEDGRRLEGSILGKTSRILTVERLSDGTRFDIPIETLSLKDRILALRLPNVPAPPPPREEAPPPPKDPYVVDRERLIAELTDRVTAYRSEIKSGSLSDILHRNRVRQLAEVESEIVELRNAIEAHRYRTKSK